MPSNPSRRLRRVALAAVGMVIVCAAAAALILQPWREHGGDRSYDTSIPQPALTAKHPRVLFDHAHHNAHSISGRFGAFAALLRADGCTVRESTTPIDAALLATTDILVIVNARGPQDTDTRSAFTPDEIAAIHAWVERGGSLLLAADHHPFGAAAAALAQSFGVTMLGGWCDDPANILAGTADSGAIAFRRDRQMLGTHVITDSLGVVATFTGQSLIAPPPPPPADATPLLLFAPSAIDLVPISSKSETKGSTTTTTFETKDSSAAGHCQALAMTVGAGRVVITGEAAMLTAQVDRDSGLKFGMNIPGVDNRQFVLNTIRWLAREPR